MQDCCVDVVSVCRTAALWLCIAQFYNIVSFPDSAHVVLVVRLNV